MKTVTLNIPDTVKLDHREVAMLVASRLYEQGKLSIGMQPTSLRLCFTCGLLKYYLW